MTTARSMEDRILDLRAVATIIAMATSFGVMQGMTYPLLALLLEADGHSQTLIGVNAAMLPLGLIVVAPVIGPLSRRFGAVNVAIASALAVTLALVCLASTRALLVWFLARLLLGAGIGGLYVLSETWLNTMVPTGQRGRWLAIYATLLGAGFALGPIILLATGTEGPAPFAAVMAISIATTGLLVAARGRIPNVPLDAAHAITAFLPLAPLLLLATGCAAAFDQATLTFLPIYVLELGADQAAATLVVTAVVIGNVLLQVPVGWLADRVSRRVAMLACAGATLAGALLLPFLGPTGPLLWLVVLIWGGVAYGTYTVALIVLGDRFQGSLLLAGNAAFAFMWGVAGLIGPTASGIAMDTMGPQGLPLVIAVLFALLTAVLLTNRTQLDRPAPIA